MFQIIVSIFILTLLTPIVTADDACQFKDKTKGVINLSSVGLKNGKPTYADVTPTIGPNYAYSFNPCKPFSEGTECIDVAVCQVSKDGKFRFPLGKQDSATWTPGPGNGSSAFLGYQLGVKVVSIELLCTTKETSELEALGEGPTNNYKFRLTHKCACWNGCKGSGGMSGGLIFILILLILAFVYFVGFTIYNRFGRHETGVNIIPHRTFWIGLPGHAKNGVTYIFQRVTGRGGKDYASV